MGLVNSIAIGLILNSIYPNTFWWFVLAHIIIVRIVAILALAVEALKK